MTSPGSILNTASTNTTTLASTLVDAGIIKEPSSLVRLVDSLVAAIMQQSDESDERQRTFLSYWMSPYAMMCMITAVIMNRVVIFASSRHRRRLPYLSNIILRTFAIYILFQGSYGLFVSLKSYSTNSLVQYCLKSDYFTFHNETFSNHTFLTVPFGKNQYQDPNNLSIIGPTTSILRNFHLSLCISQILDTFISVASGLKPSMETGITLFEYSLAFQEAQFDIKLSIEMLIIAFIALSNQINIHLLGLFNLTNYKLITSSIIGVFTLLFYGYNIITANILNLPFTIIIGYFPHFCVLSIILLSEFIFLLSGIIRMSFTDLAMSSLLGNWNSVNISLSDDFYTALISFGEFVINISISQCYVQETSSIVLPKDNYINSKLNTLQNKITKNGYGNKLNNNPDLQIILDSRLTENEDERLKRRKSWILIKRLRFLNLIFIKFMKLIKLKILSIIKRSSQLENSIDNNAKSTNNDSNVKKYSILKTNNYSINNNLVLFKLNNSINNANYNEIDINKINTEELNELYAYILLNTDLMELDDSADYIDDLERTKGDELEESNYDEDFEDNESDLDNDENIETHDNKVPSLVSNRSTTNELMTLQDLQHLLIPESQSDIIDYQIMTYHLQHLNDPISKLTRSNFNKYYTDDLKLIDLLIEKKKLIKIQEPLLNGFDEDKQEIESDDLGICVICHENSRQIILWPCKCLAICEQCRVSLFVREFANCVCCRRNVEGYSKVYIP